MNLYSRQQTLPLLTYDYAVVVGLGGIGNWIALDLALSGCVKNLVLIDPDKVEEHNLNRTIFTIGDIGSYKVDAVKNQILERRTTCFIQTYNQLTNPDLLQQISSTIIMDQSMYDPRCLIMDCRDDIYDDLFDFNCKLYKVGYDGTSMTIDGNPRLTKIFTQRGGSYSVVPSYIGSSQLVAVLAVNDALGAGFLSDKYQDIHRIEVCENPYLREIPDNSGRDEYGRLNCCIRFSCQDIFPACAPDYVKAYDVNKAIKIMKQQIEE